MFFFSNNLGWFWFLNKNVYIKSQDKKIHRNFNGFAFNFHCSVYVDMKQFFKEINIKTNGQKLIEITNEILNIVDSSSFNEGILNLSILHTSASLIVQENADPDVQKDLLNFFAKTVPMNQDLYIHDSEGRDDMPAHIKTALTNTHISLSIRSKKLILGTWQGIYLFEHRLKNQNRTILVHILGN